MNHDTKKRYRSKVAGLEPSIAMYGKMQPQAVELENMVLGAVMLEPNKLDEVVSIIPSQECFYSDPNQRIYASIQRLSNKGSRIDFMTVCEDLRSNSELEMVGGSHYVTSLTRDVVSAAHIEEHARIVMQKFFQREVIRISGELINEAYEDSTDSFDLMEKAEREFTKLTEDNIRSDYKHISHQATADLEELDEQMKRIEEFGMGTLTGVKSGFKTIDKITNGWQPGDLIILAARPAVGKTAFSLNLAMNAEVPVGFFSLEMTLPQLRKRIISMQTNVGLTNISSGQLNSDQFDKIRGNISRLRDTNLYVDDSDTLTVFDLKSKVRRMKKKERIQLVIIDYLQLITASNERAIREQQVSQISRELKKLAKELQIPIIALSQLSRSIDTRKENKEPVLSDLRESGAIEQDADLVSFLYWYDNMIRWKLAKHRNGKLDRVDFIPNLDIQKFVEVGQEFPEAEIKGYSPTPHSGRLIPIEEANKKFEDEEDLPF